MKVRDVIADYREKLSAQYDKDELNEIISLALEAVKGFTKTALTMQSDAKLTTNEAYELGRILYDLKQNKPIQYILGYSWFYGMKFTVNEDVLIPRPETEELCRWIIETAKHKAEIKNVLDIGTGSGCIAIAVKKNLSHLNVTALDVSGKALAVAKTNAEQNQTSIHLIHADILQQPALAQRFDIIVSNPPYVLHSDKTSLHERVIKHEPHLALFADEEDALVYYKAIADFAAQHLNENGILFFEIHESKGKEVTDLFISKSFRDVELRKDISGKDRMIKAVKKS
jgi:release factor glutamine methyltransferase